MRINYCVTSSEGYTITACHLLPLYGAVPGLKVTPKSLPRSLPDPFEVRVTALTRDAEGQAFLEDGTEISVPFTLPGEKVQVKPFYGKRRKPQYDLLNIISESSERVQAPCPAFTRCGGCTLQHMNLQLYKEVKKSFVTQALIQQNLDPFVCDDVLLLPMNGRRRANLEAVKKENQTFLGFHRWKSHQIIDLQGCHVLHPDLSRLIPPLRRVLNEVLLPGHKAQIFLLKAFEGIDISLEIQNVAELTSEQQKALRQFAEQESLARLFFRHRKQRFILHQTFEPHIIFDEIPVPVDAYSFVQANEASDDVIANILHTHIPPNTHRFLDLFSGRGTLSFPLSRYGTVHSVEWDKEASETLATVAQHYERPIVVERRNLYEHPLTREELADYDCAMIDPPRAGAEAQMKTLAESSISQIMYLSCQPLTFARDISILVQGGYTLKQVIPIDQFYGSAHVECFGILNLSRSS